jgi:hypothetical protein
LNLPSSWARVRLPTTEEGNCMGFIATFYVAIFVLKNRTTPSTLHKVRAYTNILGNEEANKLAKEGSKIDLENDMPTQSHENAHSTT